MQSTNMLLSINLVIMSLSTFVEMTNSRTSTMWKLNTETGKIQNINDIMGEHINSYSSIHEDIMYNFNALAEVYSTDEAFFTIVSSTRTDNHNGWLRQSAENSLEALLELRKLKNRDASTFKNKKVCVAKSKETESEISVNYSLNSIDILDGDQPVNYTHYEFIVNLDHFIYKQALLIPESKALEKHIKCFHLAQIGKIGHIIDDSLLTIKCFCYSLHISSSTDPMYDLGKILHNLLCLDDVIHMTHRSGEFQKLHYTSWRQHLLFNDIIKIYGDLHYYRSALEINPSQQIILRTLNDNENRSSSTLHAYTIIIVVILVVMVLVVILTSMITDVRTDCHFTNARCSSESETYDIKPHRNFNRAIAIRSLKRLPTTRSTRQRKY